MGVVFCLSLNSTKMVKMFAVRIGLKASGLEDIASNIAMDTNMKNHMKTATGCKSRITDSVTVFR